MRQYETVFLISPNLEEEETTKVISQISGIISKNKGKLIQEDRWGKKKLAYPIKKFEEAFYVLFHYEGDSKVPLELEKRFKQTEAILRFLTVKKETRENVRRKRRGVPEEEAAALAEEEEKAAPEEDKVELKEEEKVAAPPEEKVAKKEKEEIEEEKSKQETAPEEKVEEAAEEREKPEEGKKKEEEETDEKKEEEQEPPDSVETSKEDK
jgi:small subunit ribosomal protein S6